MSSAVSLPPTSRALVSSGLGKPLTVQTVDTPDATPGSVVVHVLACGVDSSTSESLKTGIYGLTIPTPFVSKAILSKTFLPRKDIKTILTFLTRFLVVERLDV
jgi:hypothetical protein